MTNNNATLRTLMDRDLHNLQFNKSKMSEDRDLPYKYGSAINQKVVEGQIPDWAKAALADHKPGEVVGQYAQVHRKQITRDMV